MTIVTRTAVGLACAIFMQRDTWPIEPVATPATKPVSLRNEVREIIRPKCGSCHTSSLPTAKPKAVAIFDLKRDDWPSTIADRQFKAFKGRLNGLADSLKTKIDEFVGDEIARRNAAR